ncbi:TIGR01777 family oxidoreductase [candidate division KSB1 bacterium]
MKVLITGATGLIGNTICRCLLDNGHVPAALTRDKKMAEKFVHARTHIIQWDTSDSRDTSVPPWHERCGEIDAVINLAGASIAEGRWNASRKRLILSSRINATRSIVEAINSRKIKPALLINASAVGYYGSHTNRQFTEKDGPGRGFLAEVCAQWEAEAAKLERRDVRLVLLRTGMVLSRDGGALTKMLPVFRPGLGGRLGSGGQWTSWIHIDDLMSLLLFLLTNAIEGPVNATAPHPVSNAEFTKALGSALGKPAFLAVPGFILRLRYGEMAEMLLEGQNVLPEKLHNAGFQFTYPNISPALESIFHS